MKRILFLLLIISGLYIVVNQTFQFDGLVFGGNKAERAAISNSVDTVVIDVSSARTTIIPENRDDIKAELTGKGALIINESGNQLEIKTKRGTFNWFSFSEKKVLKIYIPEDYNKNMVINIGSGQLEFSGESMKLDELSLDIGSGNVNLDSLVVNKFNHDGSSGNVEIDNLKTNSGTFDLSSGNLSLTHYTGAIKADISSGRLNVQMDNLTDSILIDLSSGKVELDLPDQADFNLNGTVSSGTISSDFPLSNKQTDKKVIKGTHGSGKHKIDISVSSGNVRLY